MTAPLQPPPALAIPSGSPDAALDAPLADALAGLPVSPRLANLSARGHLDPFRVRDLADPVSFALLLRNVRLAGAGTHAEIVGHCEEFLRNAASAGKWSPTPDRLQHALDRLEARHAAALVARYGLDGQPPATLDGVGKRLGVGKERVRQLASLGLRGLARLWPEACEAKAEASPRGALARAVAARQRVASVRSPS
jgi:hypothetical protein